MTSTTVTFDTIVAGDNLAVLPTLPAGCADLVFADPPFNIGYKYDKYRDKLPRAEYLARADKWLAECARVLKPTGSLWINAGAEIAPHLHVRLEALLGEQCWRNTIIWHYTFGPHQ